MFVCITCLCIVCVCACVYVCAYVCMCVCALAIATTQRKTLTVGIFNTDFDEENFNKPHETLCSYISYNSL